ncbi:peptide-methionine (S)-S-oxide reductase MsrA [Geosporobacter ferrireducens]|uniref:Peptide methionine sulfoxide reductase MsrA n=1 Tax=Geosporobacter ferrireducens TaxID=1424294 RepID=A0A1D8GIW9_9FIRM|nr:peptide-methionine (S)-S-oxide reductase MsrA [Geosporobacter ferrireducens]AOT70792.1 peptide-methionine (S)-S-oxide reductase [Geosporobacter ferrireducens]MTI53486.1 peptide-methionine (S)-S-oxide reductase MsrA [Geosporobacter ferrireducens]
MKEIILAGGCFWGVEAYLSRLEGVVETKVGYANGHIENPTYQQVCTAETGHTEACYVRYDEIVISLEKLLNHFWKIIDPTVLNRQGPDIGAQYRTGIYYKDKEDLEIIFKTKAEQEKRYPIPIVTEIEALRCFYPAEEYHQRYLEKNPGGYCHIDLDATD